MGRAEIWARYSRRGHHKQHVQTFTEVAVGIHSQWISQMD